ncbi:unnamed protein product, partial [marine sediment metagenome]
ERVMAREVGDISFQTLEAIGSNIKSVIEIASNYSKMILAGDPVRYMLTSSMGYQDITAQKALDQYLRGIMESSSAISSIYLFDNNFHKYAVSKSQIMALGADIDRESWYQEMLFKQGGFILKLNGGGLFLKDSEENFVSHLRIINDIHSLQPIGILILNIPERCFLGAYAGIRDKYGLGIIVKDENNQDISRADQNLLSESFDNLWKDSGREYDFMIRKEGRKEFLISFLNIEPWNWKVISIMPFS